MRPVLSRAALVETIFAPDDPVLPEGDGWDLVGFAASGIYLYWTWRRLRG